MTGSFDSKAGNAPDKVSENTTQPTEAVAPMQQEVAKVPPAEQKSIIDEGRGANMPVPTDFKSKDGTDASVNKAAGVDAQGGTGKPESTKQEEVISKTYDKHVESTLGNDTKGSVSETVRTETVTKSSDLVNQAQSDSNNLSKMVSEAAALGVAGDNNSQDKAKGPGNDANNSETVLQQAKSGDQAAKEKSVQQGLMNPEEVKSKEAGADNQDSEDRDKDGKGDAQASEDVNNKKNSLMSKGISEEAAAVIAASQAEGDLAPARKKR
jgi:hypothetical protein